MPRILPTVLAFLVLAAAAAGHCGEHPWCDTKLAPDARAGLLLAS